MTGTIGPGAHMIAERERMKVRIAELERENAELRRQLELAKSDALIERPMAQPGYAHHQGGTPCLDE
jgi:hypothetical protein